MGVYNPQEIEPKWQRYWDENNVFVVSEDPNRPKYYVLDMFPYPSGAGLHVGHPEGYTATDIIARYKRMKGFNVLHPMGWDAFGLPAEQYALQTGTHPAVTTKKNINNFRSQLKRLGFGYDWSREVATCDEDYYKWTQWIFTKLYQKGLAYIAEVPVNWCPELGTVLANEEVIDGKSERGGYDVIRRPMRQWMLKITDYAESLLDGLDGLDWPEPVKEMQRNWIGKSEGALVRFSVTEDKFVEVYTTRPDTLFGATYLVLAPEHELVGSVTTTVNAVEVKKYVELAVNKTDRARLEDAKQKTGVFTGGYATNPLSGETVPIYVADYVLVTYGTGAIMAVPGHDERDYEFAQKFGLEIREVVSGGDLSKEAFTGNGPLVNSGEFSGLSVSEAKKKIIGFLEKKGLGTKQINYKLRDWLFSRQRYWGEPFPIVHKDGNPVVLDESELPVVLPEVEKYQPTEDGEPPLARAKNWLEFEHGEHGQVVRETNTMPQWAGSCWYYLRYIDPQNAEQFVEKEKEEYWMPVDLYIGGTEHAVLHLLYSRFWHHVLHDLGLVSCREPFRKLVNQGMILGEDGQKMSKARGNVVNPDDIVDRFGADTLRLYEMFMGPLEQVKPWNTNSVGGVHKFLKRAYDWITSDRVSSNGFNEDFEKLLHQTIKKVTDDIENLRFHTAISQLMVCNNEAIAAKNIGTDQAKRFLQLVSPFAPHLGEELWSYLGETNTIADSIWPTFDEKYLAKQEVTVVFQVNGKVRDKCLVSAGLEKSDLLRRALSSEKVKKYLEEKEVVREIVVPDKLVNIVVK